MVYSTNKTDQDDITEVLLKVVLNTLNPNPNTANFDMYQYISLVMSTVSVIRRCYKFIFVCRPIVAVQQINFHLVSRKLEDSAFC
jgi:poly-beta-hydroxyalkanoate depolymerase